MTTRKPNPIEALKAKLQAAEQRDTTTETDASARPDADTKPVELPRGWGPKCVEGTGWRRR